MNGKHRVSSRKTGRKLVRRVVPTTIRSILVAGIIVVVGQAFSIPVQAANWVTRTVYSGSTGCPGIYAPAGCLTFGRVNSSNNCQVNVTSQIFADCNMQNDYYSGGPSVAWNTNAGVFNTNGASQYVYEGLNGTGAVTALHGSASMGATNAASVTTAGYFC